MGCVGLVHWNAAEAAKRAAALRTAGYEVIHLPVDGVGPVRALRGNPPAAFLIDLGRLPMQGRDIAILLRQQKATRLVPLIFVEGDPAKVSRVRQALPDAMYTDWSGVDAVLREALANPPVTTVVPRSIFDVYAGTPLVQKLGIKPGSLVALIGAPDGFERTLGELPGGVTLISQTDGGPDLALWFVLSKAGLEAGISDMIGLAAKDGLWIVWPKRSSGVQSDLNQINVRRTGLEAGIVDYKICAIDQTWSGLLFTERKPRRR